ncbi:hypothetical protein [Actinomycetospora cinnamomea]|uniref:Uncharacterized protein n=1 Tax=Actinomycetospora cinnamomea TaxID=663609 RepID=A0A2U1F8N1_9PSEU|nr:hypothetical protein [Actinomycetospora cinnamomea]PVZ08516.1 hypothetical protein C8D89_108113 [Actinomycetospora cinnamomea]
MRRGEWAVSPDLLMAASTEGVISVRALVALGVDETTAYRRCRQGGPWQRLLPGIVLLHNGTPTRREREIAALLYAGDFAVLTGLAALRHHGLRRVDEKGETVHVLVRADRQVRSAGFVVIERTTRLPRPLERDGLAVAPLVRAALDEARRRRDPALIAALLAEPVQRRMLVPEQLAEELEAGCRRGTAAPRVVVRSLLAGVWSAAEFEARDWWIARGLPDARFNVGVLDPRGRLLGIVDVIVEDVGFGWEIDSVEAHFATPDQVEATARRRRLLRGAGLVVVGSRPTQVRDDGDGVEQDILDGLAVAALLPAPDVRYVDDMPREA